MIKPRIAEDTKALIIFDVPQHPSWTTLGKAHKDGVEKLVRGMVDAGIDLNQVSMLCLSDDKEGKAAGFKEKRQYVDEWIDTLAPNVIVLASSKAHEKYTGVKGASKFYNRVWHTEGSSQKLLTIPPYSACAYNPDLLKVIEGTLHTLKVQMEFPEIIEAAKVDKQYVLVNTIELFREWLGLYKTVDRYALDTETNSLQFNNGKLLTVQFSEGPNKGWCIPTNDYCGTWAPEEWEEVVAGLKEIIEDDSKERILANAYFDFKFLHHALGIKLVKHNITDVLIQSFLVDENRESHSLKYCAASLLPDAGDYERPLQEFIEAYCKENKIKKADFTYDLVPLDILFPYSCMDVDYSYQLANYFKPFMELEEQTEVYKDVIRYAWALARIELSGWQTDLEEAAKFKEELEQAIAIMRLDIQELPEIKKAVARLSIDALVKENAKRKTPIAALKKPLTFLVNSVVHKRLLFRDVLKFPEVKKTKKGAYATDKECFAAWSEKYPEVKALALIKGVEEHSKMLNTYVMALLNRSVASRIHCSYRVTGTATGRISASAPNLQNVSQHSDLAKKLKKCFVAKPGHVLVACDLSNAELRVTAAISQDPVMCDSFIQGFDPHSSTAKAVFNLECEVSEIKSNHNDLRQRAKTLNFAALYGSSSMNIAKSLNISQDEAQQLLDDYFKKHSGVTKMFKNNLKYAREHGYVVYPSGRRRRVPHINSEDRVLVSRAERQVNNSVIQGSSSDIALYALATMWEEIDERKLPFTIINIIHDSIEMEVPETMVEEAIEFITRNMSTWGPHLTAPFVMKCDAEVGKTWADLKEFEHEVFVEEEEEDQDEEEE